MELALSADSSWNRWHPTYEQLAERCERLGIGAFELVFYPDNDGFETAADVLASKGARVVCINSTAKWRVNIVDDPAEAQANIIRCISLASSLGSEFVIVYLGHNSQWTWKTTLELTRRRLDPCLEAASERGITLLLENHFDLRNEDPDERDVVRNPDLTALFLEAFDSPSLRLNFDPGNLYAAGYEPWPYSYRILKDYIAYAHLKDMARFSELLHGPLAANETLADSRTGVWLPVAVGDGGINYAGMLPELAADGVAAYATFEDHSLADRQEEILERGVSFARKAIAEVAAGHV